MKIIDFARRGNVVRFFLGKNELKEWWGDDWDDTPYEHNAGPVYDRFVSGHVDIAFPFDYLVLEPCDGEHNSPYCKEDMINRTVPCLITVPKDVVGNSWYWESFEPWAGAAGIIKCCFGDRIDTMKDTEDGMLMEWEE